MAGEYETLELIRDGAVATLALTRPPMNAWDGQLSVELHRAILEVAADDAIRALLLTGRGRAFSAGADVKAGFPPTPDGDWDVRTRLQELYNPLMLALRTMPKPVVSAVHGAAAGIGASLALAADLVLAAESSYFMFAFINIAFASDGGAAAFTAARVGVGRATELAMLGEPLPAPRALEWGLVNRVVPDARLEEEALALARRLAEGPTRAYATVKEQLNAFSYRELADYLALEADVQQRLTPTHDHKEGVAAFLEKRAATFNGS